jgi:hypothetical protein
VTQEKVCDCAEALQPDALLGFTITTGCKKRDIDECNFNNGNCHLYAYCTNIDVTGADLSVVTHECDCRPGYAGDGVESCVSV